MSIASRRIRRLAALIIVTAVGGIAQSPRSPEYAPNRLIVRYRADISKSRIAEATVALGARIVRDVALLPNLRIVELPAGLSPTEAVERIKHDPAVLYAEPDYIVHTFGAPNDPDFSKLWGLRNTGQNGGVSGVDIHAVEAWDITTGSSSVVVGIIDTGVQYTHPDLVQNIFRNEADCNSNGIDDDGNGFIDDCYGLDTTDDDPDPMDEHGHGTHVAGTIGAAGNNSLGVVGVNWQVKMVACRFLSSNGSGYTSDAIACIDYMAALKRHGVNLIATSNSWGGPGYSRALEDAIAEHTKLGILFIAAAGNSSQDNDHNNTYPANFVLPNLISVAATDSSDRLASFTDFGTRSVHIAAPGVDIFSTFLGSDYKALSGTSMATPHVTGVAALLKAQDPSRDWRTIKNLILAGGDATTAASATISGRRLNAYGALTCDGKAIQKRLLPRMTPTATIGYHVPLQFLNISCGFPAGNVVVTVSNSEPSLTLVDDGTGADQQAGDGIYSGEWIAPALGSYTLSFPGSEQLIIQVISPYNYSFTTFTDHSITGTALGLQHDTATELMSPFTVHFGGGAFDKLYVGSAGVIGFSGPVFSEFILPLTDKTPENTAAFVAPLSLGLQPDATADHDVFWGVRGAAPNRELVVEWRNLRDWTCAVDATVTFQVVFFENDSKVLFQYPDSTFGGTCAYIDAGPAGRIGVQVVSGASIVLLERVPDGSAVLWTLGNANPTLGFVTPFSSIVNAGPLTVTATGTDFLPTSRLEWNQSPLPTVFVSSTELSATVTPVETASEGFASVRVNTPGATPSAELSFQVFASYPVPQLNYVSNPVYTTMDVMSGIFISGADFVSDSVARWNGSPRQTRVIDSGYAFFYPLDSDIHTFGTAQLTIENPQPGGGLSNPMNVEVTNPRPVIYFVSPIRIDVGETKNIVVYGNLARESVVRWNGSDRPTSYATGTLRATLDPADVAVPANATVTVFTPPPGGGLSDPWPVQVKGPNPKPTLKSISPTWIQGGSKMLTLTLDGSDFINVVIVYFGVNDYFPARYINDTRIVVDIPERLLTPGLWPVMAGNPGPGGGNSNTMNFAISDFTLSAAPESVSVSRGSSATYNITVTAHNGEFNAPVSLACDSLPYGYKCSFSTATVTPGATSATTVLTLTPAQSAASHVPPSRTIWLLAFLPAGFLLCAHPRRRRVVFVLLIIAAALPLITCGGSGSNLSSPPPPGQNYTFTVSGTSGSIKNSKTLILQVP